MARVKIVSDSTCDLGKVILRSLDVDVIPLYIEHEGKMYKDGEDITTVEMYELIKKSGVLTKTSCRAPEELRLFFKKFLGEGYDQVVYMGIGSTLSGTFNNARLASLELGEDKVFVVDSKNLSSGIGLLVYKACEFRDQGLSGEEIAERLNTLVPKVRSQFVIDKFDNLHKGGRCSGMAKVLGTMLRIKPNIKVIDGKLDVVRKPIGMKRGLLAMLQDITDDFNANNVDLGHVMVTHSFAKEDAQFIIPRLVALGIPEHKIVETKAGCVISTHCGEGTIGILYIANN